MPLDILSSWHEFFSLIGSAAATLVGLMFVAASVGTGVFNLERQVGLRIFLSPTVVAFSVVLASSLIGILPAAEWLLPGLMPGLMLGFVGLLGLLYSARIWRRMVREGLARAIDLEDRLWYAVVPAAAYALLAVAGLCFPGAPRLASVLLPTGMSLLLLAGIRNAWDMTTWAVLHRDGLPPGVGQTTQREDR